MSGCPVCGNSAGLGEFQTTCTTSSGGRCSYFTCTECGSWTWDPSTVVGETAYPDDYYGTNDQKFIPVISQMRTVTWWRRARQVHRLRKGVAGDVLDIGCGDGIFLQKLSARGWRIHGTELAGATFKRASRIAGIDLSLSGDCQEFPWADASMDVVTIWHVLEHIVNPDILMRECRRVLKTDGVLIVEVPNVESLQARIFQSGWFGLDPPRHVTQFSRRGLHALLARTGLSLVASTGLAIEMGVYGIIQSLLNLFIAPRDLLFDTWCKGHAGIHLVRETLSALCAVAIFPIAVLGFVVETAIGAGAVVK